MSKHKDNLQEYKVRLQSRVGEVVNFLIGQISLKGKFYEAGDIDGNPGDSFKVNSQTGVFSDFATGQSGDVIELFRIKCNGDFGMTMRKIREFLGEQSNYITPTKTVIQKPKKDYYDLEEEDYVYDYFNGRGISEDTVKRYSRFIKKRSKKDVVYCCGTTEGGLIYVHYKSTLPKDDPGYHKPFGSVDCDKCLWGHDHSDPQLTELVITEGMEDAMCFIEQGCEVIAVSIPGGARNSKWMKHSIEWVKKFRKVYIATDGDEPGEKAAEEIVIAVGAYKCRRVKFGDFKDANDFHINDSTGEALKKCLEESIELRPTEILNLKDVREFRKAKGLSHSKWIAPFIDWKEFRWKIRLSELTIVTGETSCGKSTVLYNAAAYYASQGAVVGIVSPEIEPDAVSANICAIMTGMNYRDIVTEATPECSALLESYEDMFADDIHIVNTDGDASAKTLKRWLEYFATTNCNIIMVDAMQDLSLDIYDNSKVNDFMRMIQTFSKRSRAHVFVTAHTGVMRTAEYGLDRFPTKHEIMGSYTIPSKAFNVLAVVRNLKKEEIMKNPHSTLEEKAEVQGDADGGVKVLKDKLDGENVGEVIYFNIDHASRRLIPEQRNHHFDPWFS